MSPRPLTPEAAARSTSAGAIGRRALPLVAFFAAAGLLALSVIAPNPGASATPNAQSQPSGDAQSLVVPTNASALGNAGALANPAADASLAMLVRTSYTVTVKPKVVVRTGPPAAGTPDPGTAQAIAHGMVLARGWGEDQYSCLVALFNRESHWNVYAANRSGAYGIPQALPGSKMASAGADWATNPATQITWGLGYIAARYGTPCGAWAHSENIGWY